MKQVENLTNLLENARKGKYAVGSFSPRYTKLILPVEIGRASCRERV